MRQLTWANLRMSNNLQAADPTSIGHIASTTLAAADELRRKSDTLGALAAKLRQPGSWLSPAATVFVNAAHEQAGHVLVLSDLMRELGQALKTLAADLGSARADAMAAIASSSGLDHASDALNMRVSAQHTLMPLGSASSPGAEEDAAAIEAAQRSASTALWAAEHRAIDAWKRAGAALDFVSNGTPAMVKRWGDPNWDPAKNVFLGAPAVLSCGPLDERGLPTGGLITAPNGKQYPLVPQTTFDRDGRSVVSSRENPAKAGDWHEIAERRGVTSIGHKAAGWEKWAVALGGGAGAPYPEGSTFDKSRLKDIRIMADGGAYLTDAEDVPGGAVKEASAEAQRGKGNDVWVPPAKGLAGGKSSTTPDAIGLAVGAISGALLGMHLNDARAAQYRIVFEEDSVGNRRARLELYRAMNVPGQKERVDIEAGYVDSAGRLAGIAVTGEDPDLGSYAY